MHVKSNDSDFITLSVNGGCW